MYPWPGTEIICQNIDLYRMAYQTCPWPETDIVCQNINLYRMAHQKYPWPETEIVCQNITNHDVACLQGGHTMKTTNNHSSRVILLVVAGNTRTASTGAAVSPTRMCRNRSLRLSVSDVLLPGKSPVAVCGPTALDLRASVRSVDAILGLLTSSAMLDGSRLEPLLHLARQFYGRSSVYTWLDADGREHDIAQGEGGEQRDSLMPALYFAVHPARPSGWPKFSPSGMTPTSSRPPSALWQCTPPSRKPYRTTRAYSSTAEKRASGMDIAHLQAPGGGTAWTGARSLPPSQQGTLVLGPPLPRPWSSTWK